MFRVLLDELESDEVHWVNSFTIHGCGTFNGLNLSMQQEESTKDANAVEIVKAGYISRWPSSRPAYIKVGINYGPLFKAAGLWLASKAGRLHPALILCEFFLLYAIFLVFMQVSLFLLSLFRSIFHVISILYIFSSVRL